MKKIIIVSIIIFVILAVVPVFVCPAYARVSPDANRQKLERSVARGEASPAVYLALAKGNSMSSVYVAELFKSGNLADTNSSQVTLGINLAITELGGNPNVDKMTTADRNAYITLFRAYTTGSALTSLEISTLFGTGGNLGSGYGQYYAIEGGGFGIHGFYAQQLNNGSYVYFAIGTGPNPTASEGSNFDAVGTIILPGTVRARAVTMTTIPETCDQIKAETNYRNGTQFDLRQGITSMGVKTQSGSSYVSWTVQPNTYRLVPLSPGASAVRVCETDGGSNMGTQTAGVASGATVTYDVAYGPPPAWFQAQGGDVYANSSLSSLIPTSVSTRLFLLDGTGGSPGVVTYGGNPTDYDFSTDSGTKGELFVSTKNWLANDKIPNRDFYNYFYSKLGSPTTPDYTNLTDPLVQPVTPSAGFYYVNGDMTTSGNWNVTEGQKYVFLVDGELNIGGNINITGNGFIAFIVKGNISVASAVGGPYNSVAPTVEGIYISGGAIHTGGTNVAGAERFVGRGMFVANDVRLERDLTSINQNGSYAAELFIYNPALLVTMPDVLKNVPVSWQEVAP